MECAMPRTDWSVVFSMNTNKFYDYKSKAFYDIIKALHNNFYDF